MYAVVRTYSGEGAKELLNVLEDRRDEVEATIRTAPGFQSYILLKTETGGVAMTICQDKAGADKSSLIGKKWIAESITEVTARPPQIEEGSVILNLR